MTDAQEIDRLSQEKWARMRNRGLSYEKASRRGLELVRTAAQTGNWHGIVDDLVDLRAQMQIQLMATHR